MGVKLINAHHFFSIAQLSKYLHIMQEVMGLIPSRPGSFLSLALSQYCNISIEILIVIYSKYL